MKRIATLVIMLAAFAAAPAAFAGNSPVQNAYPLTITVQAPVKGGGDIVPYVVTVTNTSAKLRFAPLVYLDAFATVAKSDGKIQNVWSAWSNMTLPALVVDTLQPGQSRSYTVWFNSTVNFPSWTDPTTGTVYASPPAELGDGYQPFFMMYDAYFKMYTSAMPASSVTLGGKGGMK